MRVKANLLTGYGRTLLLNKRQTKLSGNALNWINPCDPVQGMGTGIAHTTEKLPLTACYAQLSRPSALDGLCWESIAVLEYILRMK